MNCLNVWCIECNRKISHSHLLDICSSLKGYDKWMIGWQRMKMWNFLTPFPEQKNSQNEMHMEEIDKLSTIWNLFHIIKFNSLVTKSIWKQKLKPHTFFCFKAKRKQKKEGSISLLFNSRTHILIIFLMLTLVLTVFAVTSAPPFISTSMHWIWPQ